MKLKPLLCNGVIHSWWYELDGIFLVHMIIYLCTHTYIYQNLTQKEKKIKRKGRLKGEKEMEKVSKVLFFAQT